MPRRLLPPSLGDAEGWRKQQKILLALLTPTPSPPMHMRSEERAFARPGKHLAFRGRGKGSLKTE
jgi:hypothetical protein